MANITGSREHDCDNNAVHETPEGASLESQFNQVRKAEAEADVKPETRDSGPGFRQWNLNVHAEPD